MATNTIVYVKPSKQAKVVGKQDITVQDLAELEGNQELVEKLLPLPVLHVKEQKEQKLYASFLDIARAIRKTHPSLTLSCVGETDTMIMYTPKLIPPSKTTEFLKVAVVCVILFFGAALAIMTFHNDAGVPDILKNIHTLLTGEEVDRPVLIILSYTVGIGVGISCFFNHFGKKKLTNDPTPVQVEFVAYKKQIDDAVIDNIEEQKS